MKSAILAGIVFLSGIQPNARVYVYDANTRVPVAVFWIGFSADKGKPYCSSVPMPNPVVTDKYGNVGFCAPTKSFDIRVEIAK